MASIFFSVPWAPTPGCCSRPAGIGEEGPPPSRQLSPMARLRLRRGDDGEERVLAERRVADHADDAEHRRAAVVALRVELEGLDLGVVVAHPVNGQVLHD